MSAAGADASGRTRIRCSAHKESRSCSNPKTFYLDVVERLVLDTLQRELRHPEVLTAYVQEYHAERMRLAQDRIRRRTRLEQRLQELNREQNRLVEHLAKGTAPEEIVGPRLWAIKHERKEIATELNELPEPEKVVALHPAALRHYEGQLTWLHQAVGQTIVDGDFSALRALQGVVDRVVVATHPNEGGVAIQIEGELSQLLGIEHTQIIGRTAINSSDTTYESSVGNGGSGRGT